MLSYNNTTEQSVRDFFYNSFIFPDDELWLFYDEKAGDNTSYDRIVVTFKQIDMGGGFILDFYTNYQLSDNGNVNTLGSDKNGSISQVLATFELHFTEQEFIDSLEV